MGNALVLYIQDTNTDTQSEYNLIQQRDLISRRTPELTPTVHLLALGNVLNAAAGAARFGDWAMLVDVHLSQSTGTASGALTRIGGLVLSSNGIAADIVEVPDLVQLATVAADVDFRAVVQLAQSGLDLTQSVGLGFIRGDSSSGESLVCIRSIIAIDGGNNE